MLAHGFLILILTMTNVLMLLMIINRLSTSFILAQSSSANDDVVSMESQYGQNAPFKDFNFPVLENVIIFVNRLRVQLDLVSQVDKSLKST